MAETRVIVLGENHCSFAEDFCVLTLFNRRKNRQQNSEAEQIFKMAEDEKIREHCGGNLLRSHCPARSSMALALCWF